MRAFLRRSMLETLRFDYDVLARSKGFSGMDVVLKTCPPECSDPNVTVIGLQVGVLCGRNMTWKRCLVGPVRYGMVVAAIFQEIFSWYKGHNMVYMHLLL
jgi:hypothetical protein